MTEVKRYEFTGELVRGNQGSCYIVFPYDVMKEFGTRKPVRIKVWFEGVMDRKSLLPRGDGTHWVSISYPTRMQLGLTEGDTLHMVIEPDLEPRQVTIPEDLEWLLDNEPDLKEVFMKQSYFNQKFFTGWIEQSASPDTRVYRINRIFEWLMQHKKGKVRELPSDPGPQTGD